MRREPSYPVSMSNTDQNFEQVPAGQYIFREGDAGSVMYIIESGSVAILRQARGEAPLAELGAGDFFGEMAILEDQPRFASAKTLTDSRLLRIERAQFADLLKQNVEVAVRIMRKLAARLRRSEQQTQAIQTELDNARMRLAAAKASLPQRPSQQAPTVVAPIDGSPAPAAAAPRPLKLVHAQGSEFVLDATHEELLVGRPDPVIGLVPEINLGPLDTKRTLSRRHAKLLRGDGGWLLREEVGTINGTFLNGQRIRTGDDFPLRPGDQLRFGAIALDVRSHEQENTA